MASELSPQPWSMIWMGRSPCMRNMRAMSTASTDHGVLPTPAERRKTLANALLVIVCLYAPIYLYRDSKKREFERLTEELAEGAPLAQADREHKAARLEALRGQLWGSKQPPAKG